VVLVKGVWDRSVLVKAKEVWGGMASTVTVQAAATPMVVKVVQANTAVLVKAKGAMGKVVMAVAIWQLRVKVLIHLLI
jgi:hypothetical protein